MDSKTLEIIKAGWAMFARYGFAKTTMSDIAREAGVARQTVYNAFSSKEDILCAVVRHAGEQTLTTVREAWAQDGTLEEKLAAFQEHGPQSWYEAMRVAPDWGDLMDGVHNVAGKELNALEDQWVAEIEALLKDEMPDERTFPETAEDIAKFFYTASKNAKFGAADSEEMKTRLRIILRATMALISG